MKNITQILLMIFVAFQAQGQNIGIGTATPNRAKLEVNGAAGAGTTSALFGAESVGVSFQRNWPAIGFNQYRDNLAGNGKHIGNGFAAIQYINPASGFMYFEMFPNGTAGALTGNGTTLLSISNTGNVGIRTGPTSASLYVLKAGNTDGSAVFGGTGYASYFNYGEAEHTYIRGGRIGGYVYLNDIPSGKLILGGGTSKVGINSGNPDYTLEIRQVNQKGLYLIDNFNNNWELKVNHYWNAPQSDLIFYYNGVPRSAMLINGQLFQFSSDARIKTNIQSLPNIMDKFMLLKPSSYEMRDFNEVNEKSLGFVAQEVKDQFPELVNVRHIEVDAVNKIPDLHALQYNGFSILAIKALQEQYIQIQNLQQKNKALLKRLETLERNK